MKENLLKKLMNYIEMGGRNQILMLLALFFILAFSRILPHPPNFSPAIALGLFSAVYFSSRFFAAFATLLSIWVSDLYINNIIYSNLNDAFVWFYSGFYWQYFAIFLCFLIGVVLSKNISIKNVFVLSSASSLLFFIVSNFGCWYGSTFYQQNLSGLLTCYAAGIPFFANSYLGDILYSFILFGGYYAIKNKKKAFEVMT